MDIYRGHKGNNECRPEPANTKGIHYQRPYGKDEIEPV